LVEIRITVGTIVLTNRGNTKNNSKMKNNKKIILIVLAVLYTVAIVPIAVAQQHKEAEAKLLNGMNSFNTLLEKTMSKWGKDVKATSDGDEIRLISIKAMGAIVDALGGVVKETTISDVDSATKEKVLNGLSEQLTKLVDMKASFEKEQSRREEFKKLSAELDASIKRLDKDINEALDSWMKKHNIR